MNGKQDDAPSSEWSAPGWRGSWLNGWLAALGAARIGKLKLKFIDEGVPTPSFDTAGDPVVAIACGFPSVERLNHIAIARQLNDYEEFPRNPALNAWHERSVIARKTGDRTVGATITDLTKNALDRLEHSPFDAAVPKGVTLHERVVLVRSRVDDDPTEAIRASAAGRLQRVRANGLGFDATRLTSRTATNSDPYVDPVIECLAFESLPLFPVRGVGDVTAVTRMWFDRQSRLGAFAWPVWTQSLDVDGIDCLFDSFAAAWAGSEPGSRPSRKLRRLGITAVYETVPYRPSGTSDTTRGYSARLAWTT